MESRLTKALVGNVIQQAVVDGEYSAKDALRVAQAQYEQATKPDATSETVAYRQARQDLDTALLAFATLQSSIGPTVPQGEILFVPSVPARIGTITQSLGTVQSGANPGSSVTSDSLAELNGGELVVSALLRPSEQGLIRQGMRAEIVDEASNSTFQGSISKMDGPLTMGPDGSTVSRVTIRAELPLPTSLIGRNVRVSISAASTAGMKLVVPITAVTSLPDGSTTIAVLPRGINVPTLVRVSTGMSADGFVVVTPNVPGSLRVGDKVVVGR